VADQDEDDQVAEQDEDEDEEEEEVEDDDDEEDEEDDQEEEEQGEHEEDGEERDEGEEDGQDEEEESEEEDENRKQPIDESSSEIVIRTGTLTAELKDIDEYNTIMDQCSRYLIGTCLVCFFFSIKITPFIYFINFILLRIFLFIVYNVYNVLQLGFENLIEPEGGRLRRPVSSSYVKRLVKSYSSGMFLSLFLQEN
jgi:hypothetical protein